MRSIQFGDVDGSARRHPVQDERGDDHERGVEDGRNASATAGSVDALTS
jgi:hypothetical protein